MGAPRSHRALDPDKVIETIGLLRQRIVERFEGAGLGEVPPYSVVVPGSLPGKPMKNGAPGPSLYCAVIVKTVDAQTRAKTAINELLRD